MSPRLSNFSRRQFLGTSAALAFASAPFPALAADSPAISSLKPLGNRVRPVTAEEFQDRARHAQELMAQLDPKFDALILGPGSCLYYFTGIRWGLSERLLCMVLPRSGQPILISPAFEEGRMRESLRYPVEVRTWQEDESPTKLIASAFADRKIATGRIGIEESLPFTFYNHLKEAAPGCSLVSADPVTIACRSVKSKHELELMCLACEATCDVFREVFASLKAEMSQEDIGHLISSGFAKMDLRGDALVLLGASAALPHGSKMPQKLKDGDVVLIDGGCLLEGYESDVTRTGTLGKPTAKVQQVFEIVRKAQDAALDAALAGKLSGTVDDAARAVVTTGGYGPDYKFFTHRLGHGLGLDGHEHPYLVRGSKTVLAPGMTFSNEPGIYIPGEFGVRCEDDMVITADGPAQLLTPGFQVSLERPLG
ncbi:MAG TPA: Xaa-Pro peptidase family protein [Candidatus Acidoferrum sp.]